MPRLPIPGSDQGSWGQILNDFLAQSHQTDGTLKAGAVTTGNIVDGTITEAKLDSVAQAKLNSVGSAVASVNSRTGAVTLTSNDVGLGNVDDTPDMNKPVSTAVQSALDGKAGIVHAHDIADVTGLQTALDAKAASSHAHVIADVTGLQTALDGKINVGSFNIDDLGDVTALGATAGQSLVFNAGTWGPATVGTGSTVVDATASVKGVVQLAGDLGGTAASPTVPGLASKASTSTTITGATSLTGGGSLAANRTLSLINDLATPGNTYYYGTNSIGTKGFFAIPTGGDPVVGGDLSGTASAAQIVAGAVGTAELAIGAVTTNRIADLNVTTGKIVDANVTTAKIANDAVTEPKLAASNAPTSGYILSWNGTALTWITASSGDPTVGGDLSGTASNAQIVASAVGATELAANAVTTIKILDANITTAKILDANVTTAKIADANVTGAKITDNTITEPKLAVFNTPATNQVLSWNGTALAWTTPSGGGAPVYAFRNITVNATAVAGDFIFADTTSGGITITLPTPAASAMVRVKRLNVAGNSLQVAAPAGGSVIDGVGVGTHTMNNQYDSNDFLSNGTNWYRV